MEASYSMCDRLPVSVSFISTYICNIICEHCDISRFREEELSTDEVRAMVRELRELGMRSLKFDGGEPLTRPDIGELLAFCREQGIQTSLCTNGLLVERNLSKLASLGQLVVSLSWTDGYTERVSIYEKSLKAIGAAQMAGLNVAASIVLTQANISALPAILDDGAALGVQMRFKRLLRHGHSATIRASIPSARTMMSWKGPSGICPSAREWARQLTSRFQKTHPLTAAFRRSAHLSSRRPETWLRVIDCTVLKSGRTGVRLVFERHSDRQGSSIALRKYLRRGAPAVSEFLQPAA